MRTILVLALSIAAFPACSKKSDSDKGGGTAAKAGDDKPAADKPAALAFKKLGSLPLEAEVAADWNIDDSTKTAGFPSVTIYASPTTFIFGAGDMSDVKPTIDETKTRLQKEVNGFKKWDKEEKTSDGWVLEGTGESMMDKTPLFAVSVRRTIDGKPYDCGTNANSKDEMAKAEKLCQSLRAAK